MKTIKFELENQSQLYQDIDNHLPYKKISREEHNDYCNVYKENIYIFVYGVNFIIATRDRLIHDKEYELLTKEELQQKIFQWLNLEI